MSLVGLLDESLVKVGLESRGKEELFEEMADMLVRAGKVSDKEAIVKAIRDREAVMTTGVGKGVAIPHAKTDTIDGVVASVGTSADGIEYDAIDGEPVHLVFFVISATNAPELNIQTLATMARIMMVPGSYRRLCEADTPKLLLSILEGLESED